MPRSGYLEDACSLLSLSPQWFRLPDRTQISPRRTCDPRMTISKHARHLQPHSKESRHEVLHRRHRPAGHGPTGPRPTRRGDRPLIPAAPSRRKSTLLAVIVVAAFCAIAPFVGAESATASSDSYASSTPDPTDTPSSSPTPGESTDEPHQERLDEQGADRGDLGLFGVMLIGGLGFVLAAGAVGVSMVARERRRRDRAETASKKETPDAG